MNEIMGEVNPGIALDRNHPAIRAIEDRATVRQEVLKDTRERFSTPYQVAYIESKKPFQADGSMGIVHMAGAFQTDQGTAPIAADYFQEAEKTPGIHPEFAMTIASVTNQDNRFNVSEFSHTTHAKRFAYVIADELEKLPVENLIISAQSLGTRHAYEAFGILKKLIKERNLPTQIVRLILFSAGHTYDRDDTVLHTDRLKFLSKDAIKVGNLIYEMQELYPSPQDVRSAKEKWQDAIEIVGSRQLIDAKKEWDRVRIAEEKKGQAANTQQIADAEQKYRDALSTARDKEAIIRAEKQYVDKMDIYQNPAGLTEEETVQLATLDAQIENTSDTHKRKELEQKRWKFLFRPTQNAVIGAEIRPMAGIVQSAPELIKGGFHTALRKDSMTKSMSAKLEESIDVPVTVFQSENDPYFASGDSLPGMFVRNLEGQKQPHKPFPNSPQVDLVNVVGGSHGSIFTKTEELVHTAMESYRHTLTGQKQSTGRVSLTHI